MAQVRKCTTKILVNSDYLNTLQNRPGVTTLVCWTKDWTRAIPAIFHAAKLIIYAWFLHFVTLKFSDILHGRHFHPSFLHVDYNAANAQVKWGVFFFKTHKLRFLLHKWEVGRQLSEMRKNKQKSCELFLPKDKRTKSLSTLVNNTTDYMLTKLFPNKWWVEIPLAKWLLAPGWITSLRVRLSFS